MTDKLSKYCVGFCTVSSSEQAKHISRILLNAKLAACVNTVPGVASAYWWEGKVEEASELLLVIKTRTDLQEQVIDAVKREHEYSVPEVIFLTVTNGNPDYLAWIADSTA